MSMISCTGLPIFAATMAFNSLIGSLGRHGTCVFVPRRSLIVTRIMCSEGAAGAAAGFFSLGLLSRSRSLSRGLRSRERERRRRSRLESRLRSLELSRGRRSRSLEPSRLRSRSRSESLGRLSRSRSSRRLSGSRRSRSPLYLRPLKVLGLRGPGDLRGERERERSGFEDSMAIDVCMRCVRGCCAGGEVRASAGQAASSKT